MHTISMNMIYEPIKNKINVQKQKIDLADVEGVFYDERAITLEDRDYEEERFITLGTDSFGRLVVVVYHYRGEDEIRVISARPAQPHERRIYLKG